MNLLHAIILGVIQGLTEFLPISSTAHLTLYASLTGLIDPQNPEQWTTFMAVVQLGTLVAVLLYFAKDILSIIREFISNNIGQDRKPLKEQSLYSRMGWFIVIGTVPIVVIGYSMKSFIKGSATKDPVVIACALILLAIILFFAEKVASHKRQLSTLSLKDALIIGFSQCLALIPGSSRSGTTITSALFLGFTRESAARFSFLLSIPAIAGSGLVEMKEAVQHFSAENSLFLIVATVVSALSGYAAIAFLLRYLRSNTMLLFVVYRIVLGITILLFTSYLL